MRKLIGALVGAAMLSLSAVAAAAPAPASAPAAHTLPAIHVTKHTALLRGRVDAHGGPTTYTFDYGPTTAYGSATPVRQAGHGNQPFLFRDEVTGLTPGTTYHYALVASNADGTTTGADGSFKTQGAAPTSVYTGPPSVVGDTSATVTGAINPNGATTTWKVQYGPTTAYGSQTFGQALSPSNGAVPVSLTLADLAPMTLFHYRIVSMRNGVATYGADMTFFTRPTTAVPAQMTTSVTPKDDSSSPYTFTTTGTLHGGSTFPNTQRCAGVVAIRYYNGSHRLGTAYLDVNQSCEFSSTTTFDKLDSSGRVKLRVAIFYRGNGYLDKEGKTDHAYAGG
jgi:hypothetical protein